MATLPTIADTWRVALRWDAGSVTYGANVIHLTAANKTADELATAMDALANPGMWGITSAQATVTSLTFTPLFGNGVSEVIAPATPNNWTGGGGEQWVPQVASLIAFTTPFRGRSARGRFYAPFAAEGEMQDGVMPPATAASTTAAWEGFGSGLLAFGIEHVVASYKLAEAFLVTGYNCRTVLATQRRRQDRLR